LSNDDRVVGKPLEKTDARSLVTGKPIYTEDIEMPGMLVGKVVPSPHAHARIASIDTSKALALPGVHAVLTYKDVPRIPFTTAGQNFPEPSPYDTYILDDKVRFIGDRVAAIAAETEAIADEAAGLIDVDYEILPAILDPRDAMKESVPVIHDESESTGIHDAEKNLMAQLDIEIGDILKGFEEADHVFEYEYVMGYQQHTPIEPHITITYLDDKDRLVIRTATQVPFHARRIVARLFGLSLNQVRVVKPRVGGAFGVKQEVLLEDICSALTIKTRKPVGIRYTRADEFIRSRTRHPHIATVKTGVMKDGTIVANELRVLANTGAYGAHGLTVQSNAGSKTLPLYRSPNIHYVCNVVYTNLPVGGAFRGYGAPQGYFALDSMMDEVAHELGMDPLEFRRKNLIRKGDSDPIAVKLGEGKEGIKRVIRSCGMDECIEKAASEIGWDQKADSTSKSNLKTGIGVALAMHGTSIAGDDMGAATIKANEDGTFHLLIGATDIGTGSDTILGQMAAEILGVPLEDIYVYSSDTDFTPFDVGAYASSTTYVSGWAVMRSAEMVKTELAKVAGRMLDVSPLDLDFGDGLVTGPDGKSLRIKEVAQEAIYGKDKEQISCTASFLSADSPPPFSATFAKVEVDIETGVVKLVDFVCAVDLGRAINPVLSEGQVLGGAMQGIGYGLCEEMLFDETGRVINPSFLHYKIPSSMDVPSIRAILVESHEPTGPFGAKSVSEIPTDSPAPAIANAIFAATGVRLRKIPFTPERVLSALKQLNR
jgi:putative selenate reductase molybdopterin-binding subunit